MIRDSLPIVMAGTADASFAPKRIAGAEVYDRRDGSWVVLDARRPNAVVEPVSREFH